MAAPWRSDVKSTDSEKVPLDPRLSLLWDFGQLSAVVYRRDDGLRLGIVYSVHRYGLPGWANSWSEAVFVTAVLAANALLPEEGNAESGLEQGGEAQPDDPAPDPGSYRRARRV